MQMLSILFLGDSEPPPNEEEDASSRARAQTLEAVAQLSIWQRQVRA